MVSFHSSVFLQSWLNYQELLNDRQAADVGLEEMGSVDHIMLTEREATFCSTLYNVAQGRVCSHLPFQHSGPRHINESMLLLSFFNVTVLVCTISLNFW